MKEQIGRLAALGLLATQASCAPHIALTSEPTKTPEPKLSSDNLKITIGRSDIIRVGKRLFVVDFENWRAGYRFIESNCRVVNVSPKSGASVAVDKYLVLVEDENCLPELKDKGD